jgi:16S rRNA (uracil1498-N3)-methyltransferase
VATAAKAAASNGARLLVAHPDPAAAPPAAFSGADTYALFIGPEGGFTAEEIDALRHTGAQLVTLGPRVLRIETAAVALLAALTLAGV